MIGKSWFGWVVMISSASAVALAAEKQEPPIKERLWSGPAPGAVGDTEADKPAVIIHRPLQSRNAGTAIVVCPGGGYGALAMDHEGRQIAEWLNDRGITAVVLKYRLGPRYRHPAPLQDAQRAVRLTRSKAEALKIESDRVGIWGFSAGGHLASSVATHFDGGQSASADAIDRHSCRPDFAILCYPVITLKPPYAHAGSRKNLLGDLPSADLIENLSNESQVTAQTPPVFLFHTAEDKPVPVENSLMFFQALRKAGVPAELHIYERGPHGVGLAPQDPVLSSWSERLAYWLSAHGWLTKKDRKPNAAGD